VNGFIQGKAEVVDLALICLLAEGYLLLEDWQDVAGSQSRSGSGRSLATHSVHSRPAPSDVTGVSVFH